MTDDDAEPRLLMLVPTTSYQIGDFLAAAQRLGVDVPSARTSARCWRRTPPAAR